MSDARRAILHQHGPAWRDRNPFLDLVLGLESAAGRYERFLADHAAYLPSREPPRAGGGDGFDHFLLGLLAFSRRLRAHLESARDRVPPRAPSRDDDAPHPGALLL